MWSDRHTPQQDVCLPRRKLTCSIEFLFAIHFWYSTLLHWIEFVNLWRKALIMTPEKWINLKYSRWLGHSFVTLDDLSISHWRNHGTRYKLRSIRDLPLPSYTRFVRKSYACLIGKNLIFWPTRSSQNCPSRISSCEIRLTDSLRPLPGLLESAIHFSGSWTVIRLCASNISCWEI